MCSQKMAEEKCCLCCTEVTSRTMKSKRIRVHEDAARMSLDVINSLALRYFGISFSMMATTSEAFFCHKCRAKAEGLAALTQKVQSVEKNLASAICVVFNKLQAADHCKRSLPEPDVLADAPTNKRRKNNEGVEPVNLKETEEVAVPDDTQEKVDCHAIWKYFMVIFRQTNHRNYAKEAALLLISYNFTSSETIAAQLLTSRFVNTKGRDEGCNMPCNLHLEHLNGRPKGTISGMESNVQPSSIKRAARAIGVVDEICRSFSDELSVQTASDIHRKPSYTKDLSVLLKVLREKNL